MAPERKDMGKYGNKDNRRGSFGEERRLSKRTGEIKKNPEGTKREKQNSTITAIAVELIKAIEEQ
ncbi:hypothetical protein WN51_05904 [Melipona quadrifasciata]|uniref:Uncharacterized protein n=1 Tax=Melipona quadrifasciata TaxID=166423 RepID=A0A0M9A7F5_9HYME|nr:hypothetical protein WN51_05904 [Melipona quadrifasciata]